MNCNYAAHPLWSVIPTGEMAKARSDHSSARPLPSPAAAFRLPGTWLEPLGCKSLCQKGQDKLRAGTLLAALRACIQPKVSQEPQAPSAELLPSQATPACPSIWPSQEQDVAFVLVGFDGVPGSPFLCLGPCEWQSCPHSADCSSQLGIICRTCTPPLDC